MYNLIMLFIWFFANAVQAQISKEFCKIETLFLKYHILFMKSLFNFDCKRWSKHEKLAISLLIFVIQYSKFQTKSEKKFIRKKWKNKQMLKKVES